MQTFMSADLIVILAAPFFLGTKQFWVSANPGFCFHKATTLGTALAIFDEMRTGFAGFVALVADLFSDLPVYNSLLCIINNAFCHLPPGGLDLLVLDLSLGTVSYN